ncbi:MAG: alpha/beta hydrolase [Rhodospirillales bacterium]|nr:alpha/beta hydrolase [Alphaproteobacteria bacterium]MCB9976102.1 alpha/beta hydrolase [Rhodospirillales bacterium]
MSDTNSSDVPKDLVILLHGMLRNKLDMLPMSYYLEDQGYKVLNILYPSRKKSLEDLTTFVHEKITASPDYAEAPQIHFVTHSMGSLVARYYIEIYKPDRLGKVVMLGPPNTGSEFADWLSETKILAPLFKKIYGPAGQQLKTTHKHIDGAITYPLGVIAGNFSINPLAPWVLPGEHDGIVPVERTKIEGMADHIVVTSTHTFMMFNPSVMKQVLTFIQTGRFLRDPESSTEETA